MACALCNTFKGKRKILSNADTPPNRESGTRHHKVHKFKWDEVKVSAKSCYCCRILESGCRRCFEYHEIKESEIRYGSLNFNYPSNIEDVDQGKASKHLSFLLANGRWFEVEFFTTDDEDCPVPDSWDYMSVSKRISPQNDSSIALNIIKGWVADCVTQHDTTQDGFCTVSENPFLPTRVVDVGLDNGTVRVVESNGTKGKYICLSHCWGLRPIITTTVSTLEERKKGILWDQLSKTFRDAISLTRTLGFKYIWIDSLCIVQDNSRDWEIESAKMASVYSNGYLTIAATRSADGQGGIFASTKDCKVSGKTPEGEDYCLYFRELIDHHIEMSDPTKITNYIDSEGVRYMVGHPTKIYYPLLTRAWVYQERMLSTRVLHFGRYEMFFECRSSIDCECGSIEVYDSVFEAVVPLIKIEFATMLYYLNNREEHEQAAIQYQCARLWRTMISSYTALYLTKSKDRLPAIGGLAKALASGRKSKYLAGLWEDSLNDDLLWTVTSDQQPRSYPMNAPTWSWASVDRWIRYWDELIFTDLEEDRFEERRPVEHFSTIAKCDLSWSAVDEFGPIAHGSLVISGLLAEGKLEREVEIQAGVETIVHYISFPNTRLAMRTDYLLDHDGPGQTNPGTSVFCLRMSLIQEIIVEYFISLVLKRSPESLDTFERIGTLVIRGAPNSLDSKGDVFQTAELQTVIII
jgi:hypothetical protein